MTERTNEESPELRRVRELVHMWGGAIDAARREVAEVDEKRRTGAWDCCPQHSNVLDRERDAAVKKQKAAEWALGQAIANYYREHVNG